MLLDLGRRFGEEARVARPLVPAVGVDAQPRALLAAQQLPQRGVQALAQDVPAGDLDGVHGHVGAQEQPLVHLLPEPLRLERVLADDEALQLVHLRPRPVWCSARPWPPRGRSAPRRCSTLTKTQFFHGLPTTNVLTSVIFTASSSRSDSDPEPPRDVQLASRHMAGLVGGQVGHARGNVRDRLQAPQRGLARLLFQECLAVSL